MISPDLIPRVRAQVAHLCAHGFIAAAGIDLADLEAVLEAADQPAQTVDLSGSQPPGPAPAELYYHHEAP